jgi:hypothetical protein
VVVEDMKAGTAYLKSKIETHPGMQALATFGETLKKQPISPEKMKWLFASLWAFYRETPSGIVSLSLRVNDFWSQRVNPWDAMEKAAYLLSASVDEFGLDKIHERFLPTHHQLFLQAAQFYQVSKEDLLAEKYLLPSGKRLGQLSAQYYRDKAITMGLGFHFASELTSFPEFKCLYEGFSAHKQIYNIHADTDPGLKFFWVHTLVEPLHLSSSIKLIDAFLEVKSRLMDEMIEGTMIYMDSYAGLLNDINTVLSQ